MGRRKKKDIYSAFQWNRTRTVGEKEPFLERITGKVVSLGRARLLFYKEGERNI